MTDIHPLDYLAATHDAALEDATAGVDGIWQQRVNAEAVALASGLEEYLSAAESQGDYTERRSMVEARVREQVEARFSEPQVEGLVTVAMTDLDSRCYPVVVKRSMERAAALVAKARAGQAAARIQQAQRATRHYHVLSLMREHMRHTAYEDGFEDAFTGSIDQTAYETMSAYASGVDSANALIADGTGVKTTLAGTKMAVAGPLDRSVMFTLMLQYPEFGRLTSAEGSAVLDDMMEDWSHDSQFTDMNAFVKDWVGRYGIPPSPDYPNGLPATAGAKTAVSVGYTEPGYYIVQNTNLVGGPYPDEAKAQSILTANQQTYYGLQGAEVVHLDSEPEDGHVYLPSQTPDWVAQQLADEGKNLHGASFRDFMNEDSGKTGTCKHCGAAIKQKAGGGWETQAGGTGADICNKNQGTKTQYGGSHEPAKTAKVAVVSAGTEVEFHGKTYVSTGKPGTTMNEGNHESAGTMFRLKGDDSVERVINDKDLPEGTKTSSYIGTDGTEHAGLPSVGDVIDGPSGFLDGPEHAEKGVKVLKVDGPFGPNGMYSVQVDAQDGSMPFEMGMSKDASGHRHIARVQQLVWQSPSHDQDFSSEEVDAQTLEGLIGKFVQIVFYNEHGVATDYETGRIRSVHPDKGMVHRDSVMFHTTEFEWQREGMEMGPYDNPEPMPVLATDVYSITRLEEPHDNAPMLFGWGLSATKTAGIQWTSDTHMGASYLVGLGADGNVYEAYYNPNSEPTPCSWAMYGPQGDTGPNSAIASGRGFATMAEAVAAAERHAEAAAIVRGQDTHLDHFMNGSKTADIEGEENATCSVCGDPIHNIPNVTRGWKHWPGFLGDMSHEAIPGEPPWRTISAKSKCTKCGHALYRDATSTWVDNEGETCKKGSRHSIPDRIAGHEPDSGQKCPSCGQHEVHHYDDNGGYNYCSNCDWSDNPERAHSASHKTAAEPSQVTVMFLARDLRIQPEDVWFVFERPSASRYALARELRIQPEDVDSIRSSLGQTVSASRTADMMPPLRNLNTDPVVLSDDNEYWRGVMDGEGGADQSEEWVAAQPAEYQRGRADGLAGTVASVLSPMQPYRPMHDERYHLSDDDIAKAKKERKALEDAGGPLHQSMVEHVNYLGQTIAVRKGAPFAGYDDFAACVKSNSDKEDPEAYCGKIKHQVEDNKEGSITAAKGPLPEHLQEYWGGKTVDPRDNPMFCARQSRKTPAIPWHNGSTKCLSCGKDVKEMRSKAAAGTDQTRAPGLTHPMTFECSNCHSRFEATSAKECPNCGAKPDSQKVVGGLHQAAAASEHAIRYAEGLTEKHKDGPWPGYHSFSVNPGQKFDKIVQHNHDQQGTKNPYGDSVHAFVEKATGHVYKADGWKRPAPGVRFTSVDEALEASDPYGGYLYKRSSVAAVLDWSSTASGSAVTWGMYDFEVKPEGDGSGYRWTIFANSEKRGRNAIVTGKTDTEEKAQNNVEAYFKIQPEALALKWALHNGAQAKPGYMWAMLPEGLSVQAAYFNNDSVVSTPNSEDGPRQITLDHARQQKARREEGNADMSDRGTPTIQPVEPAKASEVTSSLMEDEPFLTRVKQSVNEEAFGSERYQHLTQSFPSTGWAGHDGFNSDHSSPSHNREIPDQRITGWPSAWGQGAERAPSEGSRHTAGEYGDVEWWAVSEDGAVMFAGPFVNEQDAIDAIPSWDKGKAISLPTGQSMFGSRTAATFSVDGEGSLDEPTTPGADSGGAGVPMSSRPQVTPGGGSEPPQAAPAPISQPLTDQSLSQPDSSRYERPTMAQRREAKIARMAQQVMADNPGTNPADAERLARMTVNQFPGVVSEG